MLDQPPISSIAASRSVDNGVANAHSASRSLGRGSIGMTQPNQICAPLDRQLAA